MKKLLKISLGILTSIGGFLDAGAIATNAAAGATFGTRLLWVTALAARTGSRRTSNTFAEEFPRSGSRKFCMPASWKSAS